MTFGPIIARLERIWEQNLISKSRFGFLHRLGGKRQRTGALRDAPRGSGAGGERASVSECGSPLPLFPRSGTIKIITKSLFGFASGGHYSMNDHPSKNCGDPLTETRSRPWKKSKSGSQIQVFWPLGAMFGIPEHGPKISKVSF